MISTTHKFILILPPKTGSVSISDALLPYANIGNVIPQRQENGIVECFDYSDPFASASKHTPLVVMYNNWDEDRFGKWDDYIKIGSIRNPWDRIISWWKWKNQDLLNKITLEKFIDNPPVMHGGMPMTNYFAVNNEIIMDDYIRMENIQEDFERICSKINVPKLKLSHLNKSNRNKYQEYYDNETIELVRSKYTNDIKILNYEYNT